MVCVILVAAALWLVQAHRQHWQEVDTAQELPSRERDHLRRRYRRRMQTSTMLGFVGVAILAGRLFPPDDPSLVTIFYWAGVALLVFWMALLALGDLISTQVHYRVNRRKAECERDRLEAQLRRLVAEQQEKSDRSDKTPQEKGDSKRT